MIIQEAYIQNFKGIERCNLSFKDGFNLIKGENGKGKTSILEALAVGLGGFIAGIEGVKTRHFSKEEIRKIYSKTGEGTCALEYKLPTQVRLTSDVDGRGNCLSWLRERTSIQHVSLWYRFEYFYSKVYEIIFIMREMSR